MGNSNTTLIAVYEDPSKPDLEGRVHSSHQRTHTHHRPSTAIHARMHVTIATTNACQKR